MIKAIVILTVLSSLSALADSNSPSFLIGGKQVSKRDAIVTLAQNPKAEVVKCAPQELSDKGTLKNRKASK